MSVKATNKNLPDWIVKLGRKLLSEQSQCHNPRSFRCSEALAAEIRTALKPYENLLTKSPWALLSSLGEKGWVLWHDTPPRVLSRLLKTSDLDKKVFALYTTKNNHLFNTMAYATQTGLSGRKEQRYAEAVTVFRGGYYDATACILFSLIDGLIVNPNAPKDVNVIKRNFPPIRDNISDLSILVPAIWYLHPVEQFLDGFMKDSDFSKHEPQELNRHWLLHGRTNRPVSNIDCLKLFCALWGILVLMKTHEYRMTPN